MWKHAYEEHEGIIPDLVMNVTGVFRDDAILRQITEAVLINKAQPGQLINTKNEWNYIRIPRAIITEDREDVMFRVTPIIRPYYI